MKINVATIKQLAYIVKGQQLLSLSFQDWFIFFFKKVRGCDFVKQPLHEVKLFPLIQEITENKIRRVVINMPPRSCKTTMMVFLMAYVISRRKPFNFIYTSYSSELLAKCANELKAIIDNDFFRKCYRNDINEIINETDYTDAFGNTKTTITKNPKNNEKFTRKQFIFKDGSTIQFSSTGGAITGFGAGDIGGDKYFSGAVIIDDPNNPTNAFSVIGNKRVKDWYDDVAMTRNNSLANKKGGLKGTIIIVQQRVCPDDLSGYIEETYNKQYKFVVCKLLDNGVNMLPDFYNEDTLEELKIKKIRFLTQYQQEANLDQDQLIFNLDSFICVNDDFIDKQTIKMALLTTDLTYDDKQGADNDFTCFCLWIITDDYKLVLLDCFYKKLHYSIDRTELLASFYNKHSRLFPMILMENVGDASFRKDQLLKQYNIKDVKIIERRGLPDISKPDTLFAGSKEIRLLNASEWVNVNKVFIKDDFKNIALKEAGSITMQTINKTHDDFVDNLADACVVMQLKP